MVIYLYCCYVEVMGELKSYYRIVKAFIRALIYPPIFSPHFSNPDRGYSASLAVRCKTPTPLPAMKYHTAYVKS